MSSNIWASIVPGIRAWNSLGGYYSPNHTSQSITVTFHYSAYIFWKWFFCSEALQTCYQILPLRCERTTCFGLRLAASAARTGILSTGYILESTRELLKPTLARTYSRSIKIRFSRGGAWVFGRLRMSPGDSNMHLALISTTLDRTSGTISEHEAVCLRRKN